MKVLVLIILAIFVFSCVPISKYIKQESDNKHYQKGWMTTGKVKLNQLSIPRIPPRAPQPPHGKTKKTHRK